MPVRKPLAQEFVRVRPELHYRETLAFIEFGDRETYIVDLVAVPELQGECFFATLFVAISRTGVLFMWPVKVPSRRQDPSNGTRRPPWLPSTR